MRGLTIGMHSLVLGCLMLSTGVAQQFGFVAGYQSIYPSADAAAKYGLGMTGSRGYDMDFVCLFPNSYFLGVGFGQFHLEDTRPVQGTRWEQTDTMGPYSVGHAEPAPPSETVDGFTLHFQGGHRFRLLGDDERQAEWGLWLDAAAGVRSFPLANRASGERGTYTRRVSESVDIGPAFYLQPRLILGFAAPGLSILLSGEYYPFADMSTGWLAGITFMNRL